MTEGCQEVGIVNMLVIFKLPTHVVPRSARLHVQWEKDEGDQNILQSPELERTLCFPIEAG
jgi:hypothetical protein